MKTFRRITCCPPSLIRFTGACSYSMPFNANAKSIKAIKLHKNNVINGNNR